MTSMRIFLFSAASLVLGGCSNQYFIRQDAITFSNGDAVASNIAVQVPDPWPRGSGDTNIPMDPVKAQKAIEKYRNGGPANGGAADGMGPPGGGPGFGPPPMGVANNGGAPN